MAFDGIVIANLVKEFSNALTGGKNAKITQTERDELLFTIKNFWRRNGFFSRSTQVFRWHI